MSSAKLRYRPQIDGLRGIAVLAVLAFHAFPAALPGGFTGVDVFFVISGFLISSILYADFSAPGATARAVIGNFYARRVRRIFPALILVLIGCYALGFYLLIPNELAQLSRDIVASAGFCLNLLLAGRTNYFNSEADSNPLLHVWSLGVEEQFYLVWPLLIWAAARGRAKILPVAVFLATCSFCWNAQRLAGTASAAFYLPQARLWELWLGAIVAAVFPFISRPAVAGPKTAFSAASVPPARRTTFFSPALSVLGIISIAAGFVLIKSEFELPNAWTLLPTGGTALLICSADSAWINRRILCHPLLVGIGLISYPLYLWHWPLLAFAHIGSGQPASPVLRLVLLAISGLLAWFTYKFVETPIRRGRNLRRAAYALTGAMVVIVACGYFTDREQGFPSRFPSLLNEIATYKYDPAGPLRQGTYFLLGDQDETKFKRDPNEITKTKPTLYLWGDSHAAALYPGLSANYGRKYNIVQRTAARTPPFLASRFGPGNARQINQYVFDSIGQIHPEIVMLEADWPAYGWEPVEETILALRAAGVPRIVLIGPVPQWLGSLPQQLFNYARSHRSEPVPLRMAQGVNPSAARVDAQMAALGARLKVEYISPCQILGDRDGFLVRTADTPDALTTYDSSHLTPSASRYVVERFPPL